jgi:DNA-binding Lrp family transcriptional regulator
LSASKICKHSKLTFFESLILHLRSGRYDLIIKINAHTEDELKEIISTDINTLEGVDATVTMIIAKEYMKSSENVV